MSPSTPNLTHKEAGNRVLMLARSDAQRTFIQTGDQQLKEAIESHYRTWRGTGAEETAKAAATLQRESYQALKRKHPDIHPRILYTTITNGSIYRMSNNDPEITKLQETHANLRIALGAGASTLNELKADIKVHESTLNNIAKEIDNSELPEDDPLILALTANYVEVEGYYNTAVNTLSSLEETLAALDTRITKLGLDIKQLKSVKALITLTKDTAAAVESVASVAGTNTGDTGRALRAEQAKLEANLEVYSDKTDTETTELNDLSLALKAKEIRKKYRK
jgi:hypothetical protein